MAEPTFQLYDFGAGWFSGLCGLLVGHPFDTVKVRQQTMNKGSRQIIRSIFRNEGISGFYKGLFMPLMSAGILNSCYFGCYGNSLRFMSSLRGETPRKTCCDHNQPVYKGFHWDVFASGCAAGFITTVGQCPIELSKIKLQTQIGKKTRKDAPFVAKGTLKYSGTLDYLIQTRKRKGFRGLFKGLPVMLLRDIPTYGIYTLVYEHSICICDKQTSRDYKDIICILFGGVNAGVWSWALIIPVDVVKSRLQADSTTNPQYKGMIDCVVKSYRKDGLHVFLRGFWMTLLRAAPVNAATFIGYETFIEIYFKLFR